MKIIDRLPIPDRPHIISVREDLVQVHRNQIADHPRSPARIEDGPHSGPYDFRPPSRETGTVECDQWHPEVIPAPPAEILKNSPHS
jgi:hypothetical protein